MSYYLVSFISNFVIEKIVSVNHDPTCLAPCLGCHSYSSDIWVYICPNIILHAASVVIPRSDCECTCGCLAPELACLTPCVSVSKCESMALAESVFSKVSCNLQCRCPVRGIQRTTSRDDITPQRGRAGAAGIARRQHRSSWQSLDGDVESDENDAGPRRRFTVSP